MLVVLAPGQGSQVPGMLAPFLDLPAAEDRLARWSEATGLDLRRLGTVAPAEELRDTAVAQPLLTAAALLSADAVLEDLVPDVVCGHSVGELAALGVAGVLAPDEAVELAATRGAAMARAAASAPTGMLALLGADLARAEELVAAHPECAVATVNGPGQVVVGGPVGALDALAATPGVRARRLDVAGAFHTSAMATARDDVEAAVAGLSPRPAQCDVVANADGAVLRHGAELLRRLPAQLTSPVRFDLCLDALPPVCVVLELAPAGVLGALVRRRLPGAEVLGVSGVGDLAPARAAARRAAAAATEAPELSLRVVPAPDGGRVEPLVPLGARVRGGDPLAVVSARSGDIRVTAPVDGRVSDWLVADGDPVRAAQPLVVLQ